MKLCVLACADKNSRFFPWTWLVGAWTAERKWAKWKLKVCWTIRGERMDLQLGCLVARNFFGIRVTHHEKSRLLGLKLVSHQTCCRHGTDRQSGTLCVHMFEWQWLGGAWRRRGLSFFRQFEMIELLGKTVSQKSETRTRCLSPLICAIYLAWFHIFLFGLFKHASVWLDLLQYDWQQMDILSPGHSVAHKTFQARCASYPEQVSLIGHFADGKTSWLHSSFRVLKASEGMVFLFFFCFSKLKNATRKWQLRDFCHNSRVLWG